MLQCDDCRIPTICTFIKRCFSERWPISGFRETPQLKEFNGGGMNANTVLNVFSISEEAKPKTDLTENKRMTVKLHKIEIGELEHGIAVGFYGDLPLMNIYHPVKDDFEKMVRHTFDEIKEIAWDHEVVKIYSVIVQDGEESEVIGYTVLIMDPKSILYSYGINSDYRRKDILKKWLTAIKNEFEENYQVGCEKRDDRGIKFFQKNGFSVVSNENDIIILKSNYEDSIA
jgi:hypothetical protein